MLAELEQRLEAEIKSVTGLNQHLTVNTLDLQASQEEVAQMEVASTKVAQEVEALTVELEAPSRIRSIDDAAPPRSRDDKKRLMMIGMITFGSFFGGLLGVALLELQTRKVDTTEGVPAELGLAVLGALPMLPALSPARRDRAARDREGPLLAQRAAGVGQRDPHASAARRPHRVVPDHDGRQCRRGRGQDVAGQLPGDEPRPLRAEDAPDRRRPPQSHDAPTLRPAPDPRPQRVAPRRGGPGRGAGGDRGRGPPTPGRRAVRPAGPPHPLAGRDRPATRPAQAAIRLRHRRLLPDPPGGRCHAHRAGS